MKDMNLLKLLYMCLCSLVTVTITTTMMLPMVSDKPVLLVMLIAFKLWMFIGAPILLYYYARRNKKCQ